MIYMISYVTYDIIVLLAYHIQIYDITPAYVFMVGGMISLPIYDIIVLDMAGIAVYLLMAKWARTPAD